MTLSCVTGTALSISRVRVVWQESQKLVLWMPVQRGFPWRRRVSHIWFLVQPHLIQDDTYHGTGTRDVCLSFQPNGGENSEFDKHKGIKQESNWS